MSMERLIGVVDIAGVVAVRASPPRLIEKLPRGTRSFATARRGAFSTDTINFVDALDPVASDEVFVENDGRN